MTQEKMTLERMTLDDIVINRITTEKFDPQLDSPFAEIQLTEQRLVGKTLRLVVKNIPRDVVAGVIDVSSSNLSKLYDRVHLSRPQSEDISDLASLWAEMRSVFRYNTEILDDWLDTRIPALDANKPKDLLQTLSGRKVLRDVLARMRDGDFS